MLFLADKQNKWFFVLQNIEWFFLLNYHHNENNAKKMIFVFLKHRNEIITIQFGY